LIASITIQKVGQVKQLKTV